MHRSGLIVQIYTHDTHKQYHAAYFIVPTDNGHEVILTNHQDDHYTVHPGLVYLLTEDKKQYYVFRNSYGYCNIQHNLISLNCIYCYQILPLENTNEHTNIESTLHTIDNPYTQLHRESFKEQPINVYLNYKP